MATPRNLSELLNQLSGQDFCYLTTTGRVSGRPHEIEIWFGVHNSTLYLLSGSSTSDWVKNLLQNPTVKVRIAGYTFGGTAHPVQDQEQERIARYLLAEKYQEWEEGKTLSQWARTALPIAVDLDSVTATES